MTTRTKTWYKGRNARYLYDSWEEQFWKVRLFAGHALSITDSRSAKKYLLRINGIYYELYYYYEHSKDKMVAHDVYDLQHSGDTILFSRRIFVYDHDDRKIVDTADQHWYFFTDLTDAESDQLMLVKLVLTAATGDKDDANLSNILIDHEDAWDL